MGPHDIAETQSAQSGRENFQTLNKEINIPYWNYLQEKTRELSQNFYTFKEPRNRFRLPIPQPYLRIVMAHHAT